MNAETRNKKIRVYQEILRAIEQQQITHNWRDKQMSIFIDMLDCDLRVNSMSDIHPILEAVREIVVYAFIGGGGTGTHAGIKTVLRMAIACLDTGIEECTNSQTPSKKMNDIPF